MTPGFPLLTGARAPLVESLVPLPAPGALPTRLWREADGPAALLAAALRHRPGAEPRAIASLWSRWYFAKLIPPALICGLVAGRSLPLDPDGTGVVLGADGLPRAIALPHAGAVSAGADPFERFAPLVRQHVAAVVEGLAAHAGLAPRILWNNAAVYADWALRRLDEAAELPPGALALVEAPCWPDGTPNPFFSPFRERAGPAGGAPLRLRRQCCLLYRLPGEGCCRACPRRAQPGCRPSIAN